MIITILLLLILFIWGIYKLLIYFSHKRPKFIITYLDNYNKYIYRPRIPKNKPDFKIGNQKISLTKGCRYFFDKYNQWYFVDCNIFMSDLEVGDKVVILCLGKYYLMTVDRKEHDPERFSYNFEYKMEGSKKLMHELMQNSNQFEYIGKIIF